MAGRVQQMMMIHPHNGDYEKAQKVAEKLGSQAAQRTERGVARNLQLQHHDGDDHGDHAVAESFKAVGAHAVYFYQKPAAARFWKNIVKPPFHQLSK